MDSSKWWLLLVAVVVIIVAAAISGGDKSKLGANAPSGAKIGTWDGECEAGPFNKCDEEGARDNLVPREINCHWSGPDVIVHVKLKSTFNARLTVGVIPRYVIEDGGQHGTAFGSEVTRTVPAQHPVTFDINAGHPKGVADGTSISECKPKLYNVALANSR